MNMKQFQCILVPCIRLKKKEKKEGKNSMDGILDLEGNAYEIYEKNGLTDVISSRFQI